jgi:hypothetical protein
MFHSQRMIMTVVKVAAVLYGYCLSSRQGRATINQEFQT